MNSAKRRTRPDPGAEIARRMADAVTYLSRVADDAGFESISADLLSIKKKLTDEVHPATGTARKADSGNTAHKRHH